MLREKRIVNLEFYTPRKHFFKNEGEIKAFWIHQAERMNHQPPASQGILKAVFQEEVMPNRIMDLHRGIKTPQYGNYVGKHSLHLFTYNNDVRYHLLNADMHQTLHILYRIAFFLSLFCR